MKLTIAAILLLCCIRSQIFAQSDTVDADDSSPLQIVDRLNALSIMAQGCQGYFIMSNLENGKYQNFFFEYHELKNSPELPDAKYRARAEVLAYMIGAWSFTKSDLTADSIEIRFIPRHKRIPSSDYKVALPTNLTTLDDQDRMTRLLNILPFISEYEIGKTHAEVLLRYWPGITPDFDRNQYSAILTYLIYDYVFNRKIKSITITYLQKDGTAVKLKPNDDLFNEYSLKYFIDQETKVKSLK